MKIQKFIFFCLLLNQFVTKTNQKHYQKHNRILDLNDGQLSMQMMNQLINALQNNNQPNQNLNQVPYYNPQNVQVNQAMQMGQQKLHQVQQHPLGYQQRSSIGSQLQHQQVIQSQVKPQVQSQFFYPQKNQLNPTQFFSQDDLQNFNHGTSQMNKLLTPQTMQNIPIVVTKPNHNMQTTTHHQIMHQVIAHKNLTPKKDPNEELLKKKQHTIDHLQKKIKELEQQIQHKDDELKKLEHEKKQQKNELKNQENQFNKEESELQKLQEEIEILKQEKTQLQQEHIKAYEDLQNIIKDLKDKEQQNQNTIDGLQEKLKQQSEELQTKINEQDDLKDQLDKANEQKDIDIKDIKNYASQVSELEQKLQDLENQKNELQDQTNNMKELAEKTVKASYDQQLQDYKNLAKQQIDNITNHLDVFSALAPQEENTKERNKDYQQNIDDLIQQSIKQIDESRQSLPQEQVQLQGKVNDMDTPLENMLDTEKIDHLFAQLHDTEVEAYEHENDEDHHLQPDHLDHVEKQIQQLTEQIAQLDDEDDNKLASDAEGQGEKGEINQEDKGEKGKIDQEDKGDQSDQEDIDNKERRLYLKQPQRKLNVQPRKIIQNYRQPQKRQMINPRKMVLKRQHQQRHIIKQRPHQNRRLKRIRKVKLIFDRHHRLLRKIPLEKFHYVHQRHISKRDQQKIQKYKRIVKNYNNGKYRYIQIIQKQNQNFVFVFNQSIHFVIDGRQILRKIITSKKQYIYNVRFIINLQLRLQLKQLQYYQRYYYEIFLSIRSQLKNIFKEFYEKQKSKFSIKVRLKKFYQIKRQ